MNDEREIDLVAEIKKLVRIKKYRIRIHAVRHMVEEGFGEKQLLEALIGNSSILEDYPDEKRCLVLGAFRLSKSVSCPLHMVCDYSNMRVIDIVTAYIPKRPWWKTPKQRG